MSNSYQQPTRRKFAKTGVMVLFGAPLVLDELVQGAAQEGPHYVGNLSGDTYNGKYNLRKIDQEPREIEPISHERDDNRELKGTADQIREEYGFLVARGIIPNVRHLHAKVGEIAQLMSRDSNYLANPQNGFVFDREYTFKRREVDAMIREYGTKILEKDQKDPNITLYYQMDNVFIAGSNYDLRLEFIVGTLDNRTDYMVIGSSVLRDVVVKLKLDRNERVFYQWSASDHNESWTELRILDGENGSLREVIANMPSSGDDDRPMQTLDLSGTIGPLVKALKKQVIYFDQEWNPINPR
jgi:hypothetical protein